MLKATLDSVARLDYPNFECVVVINNTPDPAFWRPIEEHCRALGERFKFINAEKRRRLQGRRAAAGARAHRAGRRDHRRHRRRLRGAIRTGSRTWCRPSPTPRSAWSRRRRIIATATAARCITAMNGEYAGFFDIGMVQRNEANAIIVHGTMCLIRRAALDAAGGWSSDTICRGHRSRPDHPRARLARPTTPTAATATACCPTPSRPTRSSATAGPMAACRSCKKHWRRFLPGASRLDPRAEARIRARLAQLARRRERSASWSRSST